jgi:hypothetical protein
MSKGLTIIFLLASSGTLLAGNEIGPEGHKLLWILLLLAVAVVAAFYLLTQRKSRSGFRFAFSSGKKVKVELKKDRLYYPRYLELTVTNDGKKDVDVAGPLLILKGFWYKRKFKLKGTNQNWFYPVYLPRNQSHTLNIDLHRFYGFDKTLKGLPKAKVVVSDVNGRHLGSRQVMLRKTLFNL